MLFKAQAESKFAYATLLYDDFLLGARVLGQSLRESGSTADNVIIVTDTVGETTKSILAHDGWIIKQVETLENPNHGFAKRLGSVYTKLKIFTLTEYDRVVFLDADTLVLENIDELFQCGPFCGVMRHAELLNSGVLVVTPSSDTYMDMASKFDSLYSYTGGDQGFLNSYFENFASCAFFEPMDEDGTINPPPPVVSNTSLPAPCRRLPGRYNGDWPILFLNGFESVRVKNEMTPEFRIKRSIQILHYTCGSAKPWMWWSRPFLPLVPLWQDVRTRLPDASGAAGVSEAPLSFLNGLELQLGLVMPPVAAALLALAISGVRPLATPLGSVMKTCLAVPLPGVSVFPRNAYDPWAPRAVLLHFLFGFSALLSALALAVAVVPPNLESHLGWMLFFDWFLFALPALYGLYLHRVFSAGVQSGLALSYSSTPPAGEEEDSGLLASSSSSLAAVNPVAGGGGASAVGSMVGVADVESLSVWRDRRVSNASPLRESMEMMAVVAILSVGLVLYPYYNGGDTAATVVPGLVAFFVPLLFYCCYGFMRLPCLWHVYGVSRRVLRDRQF